MRRRSSFGARSCRAAGLILRPFYRCFCRSHTLCCIVLKGFWLDDCCLMCIFLLLPCGFLESSCLIPGRFILIMKDSPPVLPKREKATFPFGWGGLLRSLRKTGVRLTGSPISWRPSSRALANESSSLPSPPLPRRYDLDRSRHLLFPFPPLFFNATAFKRIFFLLFCDGPFICYYTEFALSTLDQALNVRHKLLTIRSPVMI